MGKGFAKKKKQAKQMQEQIKQMQIEMENKEFSGESPGKLVQVTVNGQLELKKIKINPECVDPEDVDGLEDLILVAFKDAQGKAEKESNPMDAMSGLGGGMPNLDFLSGLSG